MRSYSGGVFHIASQIETDLKGRNSGLHKPHIGSLSDLAACALTSRSANTAEWISVLPRKACDAKSKERFVSRVLSNKLINPTAVMGGFLPDLFKIHSTKGRVVVLMLDQSKISDGFECLMLSLPMGERAIPLAWKVIETKGPIGFEHQLELLESVLEMIPKGCQILLTADRFYGTKSLITWCQKQSWQYRLRLKSNLDLTHEGVCITTGEAAQQNLSALKKAILRDGKTTTHIGILHEKNHPEPWIIAMDCPPSKHRVLDYGMRWGIECLFSDFKSRGFGITKTQIRHADRLERLILVLTIALYWAVSTGMKPREIKNQTKKNNSDH